MSSHSGILGKAVKDSNTIANISEWTLDIKHAPVDDTEFTDTWESDVAGILSASGTLKGSFDEDDTYQAALQAAMLAKTSIVLKLYYDGSNYWSIAAAYLTDLKSSNNVKGKVEVEYGFKVNGAVTQG